MARDLASARIVNDSPNLLYGTRIERGCPVWKPLPVGRLLSGGRVVWNVMYPGELARLVVGWKIRVDGSRAKSSSLLVIYNAMKIVVSQYDCYFSINTHARPALGFLKPRNGIASEHT
jgi:hypothetical protein